MHRKTMRKINKLKSVLAVALMAAALPGLVSCSDDNGYAYDNQIHSFGPCPVLRGETIEILGEGLTGVEKIVFPVDVTVTEFVEKTDSKIVVSVPQEAVPGKLHIFINGQDIETKSIITYKEPISIESVTVSREPLLAGDEVVVKGDYVYNIASVIVGKNKEAVVEAKDFTAASRHEVRFKVPAEAISGPMTFSDGNNWDYTTKQFEVISSEYSAISKKHVKFNEEIAIKGTNLQLVKSLIYPGEIVDTTFTLVDNQTLRTRIPAETCSGPITMVLFSQNRLMTDTFKVPTIQLDTVMPAKYIQIGDQMTAKGTHMELVRQIVFSGDNVTLDKGQFEVNAAGTQIKFKAPEGMTDGPVKLIQNDNISAVSSPVALKKEGNIFWEGSFDLGDWAANMEIVNCPGAPEKYAFWVPFNDAIQGRTGTLTINYEPQAVCANDDCNWWQIELRYTTDWSTHFVNAPAVVELAEGQTSYTIHLEQADIDELAKTDEVGGWAISGVHVTIKSFEFAPDDPAQKPVRRVVRR